MLERAFPGSPIFGTGTELYNKTVVAGLKFKLLTNTIENEDLNTAQAYYGFDDTVSSQAIPSSGDLSFGGAPFVPGVDFDTNGKPIASPYMPNLVPPVHMNGAQDNPIAAVITVEQAGPGTTPGVGTGLMSPSASSEALDKVIVETFEDSQDVAPHQQPGSSTNPVTGF